MGVDTFICGGCQQQFHDINTFLRHKNEGCPTGDSEDTAGEANQAPQAEQELQMVIQTVDASQVDAVTQEQAAILTEQGQGEVTAIPLTTAFQLVQLSSGQQSPQKTSEIPEGVHVIVEQSQPQQPQEAEPPPEPDVTPQQKPPGRRRGRPRKGEEKTPKESPKVVKDEKPTLPDKGKDGKYHCGRCKKAFAKERHFNTHRCLAFSDYVDITKKEALGMGSEGEESEEEEQEKQDGDRTADFRVPSRRGRPRTALKPENLRKSGSVATSQGMPVISLPGGTSASDGLSASKPSSAAGARGAVAVTISSSTIEGVDLPDQSSAILAEAANASLLQPPPHTPQITEPDVLGLGEQESTIPGMAPMSKDPKLSTIADVGPNELQPLSEDVLKPILSREQIPDIPVFQDEDDKIAFEESLNVDLSQVDAMFKIHVINQNVNDQAPPPASRTSNELSIFSCNVCEKVFKTLSHMRLHCLTHTDLKPFKCNKCNYASNSKGNLYTHMRKHTGQLYCCSHCDFRSVNKSHLVEHEATHSNIKHKCEICKKDYNTLKSLINHIRKYHRNCKNGQEYLNKFQGKQSKGAAVLHQCHVCNRKFKKKIDRDRHLFVHNIRDALNVHSCELCEYAGSRRVYLENHFRKHRVVYICYECGQKFASTLRLNQHLSEDHQCGDMDERWVDLFQKCINSSLFLPEPDGSTDDLGQSYSGRLTNSGTETNENGEETGGEASPEQNKSDDASKTVSMETSTGDSANTSVAKDAAEGSESTNQKAAVESLESTGNSENNENTAESDKNMDNESDNAEYDIYKRLQYCQMSMDIFHKLRQTFGNEECEYCGRLFYSRTDYEPHVRTHTGDKPFACNQCTYRAITKDNLKRHIEKEHDKVKYICNVCDFAASSRTQLWHHQQKHKGPVNVKCPECDVAFNSNKRLRIHLVIKHPQMSREKINKLTSSQHRVQGKLGRRSYKCPYCGKTFMRASSDLQKHIWIHEGIKPFKCPLCPHACRSKNNLAAHMLRHSTEKPYLCTECGKAYKSKTALRWHVRTHKDGKIFKCPKCPYEAVQRSHLKRHMEIHDVVKRFVCQHCDYSANTLGYMKIHYTRHHKGLQYTYNPVVTKPMAADTKVYRCLSCDYLFGNLSDMKRHLKIRHHVQVEDIRLLEQPENNQDIQASAIEQGVPQSEVQVVQVTDPGVPTAEEEDATTALQALQYTVPTSGMDERTASAVTILQQIIDMSQQGVLSNQQQITVQSEDGQMVAVNPDTIIVQQEGEEVVVASANPDDQTGQYVIQYVTQAEAGEATEATELGIIEHASAVEVSEANSEAAKTAAVETVTAQIIDMEAAEGRDISDRAEEVIITEALQTEVPNSEITEESVADSQIITTTEQAMEIN